MGTGGDREEIARVCQALRDEIEALLKQQKRSRREAIQGFFEEHPGDPKEDSPQFYERTKKYFSKNRNSQNTIKELKFLLMYLSNETWVELRGPSSKDFSWMTDISEQVDDKLS